MLKKISNTVFFSLIISISCYELELNSSMLKSWPFTCDIANCPSAISQCINQCSGEISCKSCITSRDPLCAMCANDIFSQNSLITIDKQDYFHCIYENNIHQTNVCQIYCKGNAKLVGKCKKLQTSGTSVCLCYNLFNGNAYKTIYGNRQVFSVARSLRKNNFAVGFTNGSINIFDNYGQYDRSIIVSTSESSIVEKITYFSDPYNQFLDIGATGTFGTRFFSEWGFPIGDISFTSIPGKAVTFYSNYIAYGASSVIYIHRLHQGSYYISPDFILRGHTNVVFCLLTMPNGDLISGSSDNTIKVWDSENGVLKKTLIGHTGVVSSLILLEDGNIASGSWDRSIRIWNTNTGVQLKMISTLHDNIIRSIALLPDGKIATASDDKTIKIWDKDLGTLTKTLNGHTNYIMDLAVNSFDYLISVSLDNTIRMWN